MKKILIILAAVIILAVAAYLFIHQFTSSLSSSEQKTVNNIFSDAAYLESHVNDDVKILKDDVCKKITGTAESNGWIRSVKNVFDDGGSITYSFRKSGSKHSIEVHCRWDMSKGKYDSASIDIK